MPLFSYKYFLLSGGTCGYLTAARLRNETSVSIGFENLLGIIIAFPRRRLCLLQGLETRLGKAYLGRAHPHALRHSRAIHLLDAGMNIKLLQNFLGHNNIINTLIYLKYSNKDLYEAIDRANNGGNGNNGHN